MRDLNKNDVFETLKTRAPRAMHVAEILSELGIPRNRRDDALVVLEELRGLGVAKEMPGMRFRLAGSARKGGEIAEEFGLRGVFGHESKCALVPAAAGRPTEAVASGVGSAADRTRRTDPISADSRQ